MRTSHTPALSELAEHLQHRNIEANPREFAAIILEIARDKMLRDSQGPLTDWVQQLAVDMLQ
jgi:hypothetical protein